MSAFRVAGLLACVWLVAGAELAGAEENWPRGGLALAPRMVGGNNPLSPHLRTLQRRPQAPHAKSKFLAANYKDGKENGLWLMWHKNGQKEGEANYKDGKVDGLLVQWHYNGQKRSEGNYKDDKQDGLKRSWHENGQKKGESNFKDGEVISEKWWNRKGEPVDSFEEASK